MTAGPDSFDPEALIDAMAPLLGLPVDPAFRPGIATNLTVAAAFARLVGEVPLGDEAEPAPVFVPVSLPEDRP